MATSDLNAQLQEAIALAQAGQREEARTRLLAIVAADPGVELAWLWLASVSSDRAARITHLERALALNPTNPTTRQAYRELTGRDAPPPRPPTGAAPPGSRPPFNYGNILVVLAGVLVLAVALAIIFALVGGNDDGDATTPTFPPSLLTPPGTATPVLSATPSDTPLPTATEGPSPTPVTLPPTWTPSVSATVPPTQTFIPTWTPQPTRTEPPTVRPPTGTFTPLPPSATPDDTDLGTAEVSTQASR
ncbi:tetratricopeptide repeat protein [Aggregatilinea lenta]|uniref:tetratricopeptide repeat protein n=1 Tax=Aggregatilinea lenta TaxID=913108 RepID=UPI000E5A7E27|nr:tetratricopeptide repeat protein [Aggregatilinea lenta]